MIDVAEDNDDDLDYELCMEVSEHFIDEHFNVDVEGYDPIMAIFSTFIHSIHILTGCGWKTEELIQEVMSHTEEVAEGTVQ